MFQSPNYTQIPNILFDFLLPDLTGSELKILLFIMRKTFGWQKKRDRISLSQIQEGTGVAKDKVIDTVKSLLEKKLILRERIGTLGSEQIFYEINIQEINTSSEMLPGGEQKATRGGSEKLPTKETLTKETNTKEKKEREAEPSDPMSTKILDSPPRTQGIAREFFLPFSINEEKYVKKALEKKGYSEEQSTRGINYASENEFWLKTIKTCDSFIKSFDTILGQSPKPLEEMTEEEQFKEMIKRINEKEPLSKFHIVLHMDSHSVEEKHYGIYIPMDIGPQYVYNRIMSLYNGTYGNH